MSTVGEQELLLEGFLRKRRDKMKLKWVTYWFRLESATLYFYSKKDGRAIHLRGQYYLCTVELVREVNRSVSKDYVFEIVMKNGKKKLLAAESACVRQSWVESLCRAIQPSACCSPGPTFARQRNVKWTVGDAERRVCCPQDSTVQLVGIRPGSAFGQWDSIQNDERRTSETIHRNNDQKFCGVDSGQSHDTDNEYYETIPPRASMVSDSTSSEQDDRDGMEDYYDAPTSRAADTDDSVEASDDELEEAIYDVPASYRNTGEFRHQGYREFTESIYDVPKSLLRKMSAQSFEDCSGGERSADDTFL